MRVLAILGSRPVAGRLRGPYQAWQHERAPGTATRRCAHLSVKPPCRGRFRWDIRENGRPIQSSIESFATEQEAHADGRHELEKFILVSRL
jgi:hypothetical protein